MTTPQSVLDALVRLEAGDRDTIQSYISELQAKIQELQQGEAAAPDVVVDDTEMPQAKETTATTDEPHHDEPEFPPVCSSGEDFDKAGDYKQQAADAKDSGDWEKALEYYTQSVLVAPPSALLYANRAHVLCQLGRFRAAVRDCDLALEENPDSAKALRVRGKARKELGEYEAALTDLSASQTIDFDEGTVEDLKFLTEKRIEMEKEEAKHRLEEEEKLKKRAGEIRKAQEEAKREAKEKASMPRGMGGMPGGMGGMPGGMGGMPGGMGGMPGGMAGLMSALMSDPELVAAMQNPKVQAALQEVMGGGGGTPNPAKVQELMSDPEVGPILQKIMSKLGSSMGMPDATDGGEDDGIPDLDAMNDGVDLDDLPDLE